jgi:hypothetical protein
MSEGPFPKTWDEFKPYVIWGSVVFTCFLVFVEKLVEKSWGEALASFLLGLGVTAVALHSRTWIERTNPNLAFVGAALAVLGLIFVPFIEEKRWPFSAWFPPASLTADEIAAAVVEKLPKGVTAQPITPPNAIVPKPEYLKDITLSANQEGVLFIWARAAITTSHMRIFVNYSGRQFLGAGSWSRRERVPIADLDVFNEMIVELPLTYIVIGSKTESNLYWKGTPPWPVYQGFNRARIVVTKNDDQAEQRIYFLIALRDDRDGGRRMTIMSEPELSWIQEWDAEK